VISIIELVLGLLGSALNAANVQGLAPEIVAGIRAAIAELEKVRGTPVTFQQLESLRVTPKW
jgi:siroheme synthase